MALLAQLRKRDFRVQWFSGKGPGGQYRNKHANCCRITHIATGMTETGQSHRSRPANQREAFGKLARRLAEHYRPRRDHAPSPSSERIRSYYAVRDEVVDHASGAVRSFSAIVGRGDVGSMISARGAAVRLADGVRANKGRR